VSRSGFKKARAALKREHILHAVGRELKERPPGIVKKMQRKFGKKKAEEVRTAILLSKARRRGARIPKKK